MIFGFHLWALHQDQRRLLRCQCLSCRFFLSRRFGLGSCFFGPASANHFFARFGGLHEHHGRDLRCFGGVCERVRFVHVALSYGLVPSQHLRFGSLGSL